MKKRFNFSMRMLFLVLGIAIGLLIGISVFFFRFDEYFSKLNFFVQKKDTIIIEKQIQGGDAEDAIKKNQKTRDTGFEKSNSADSFAAKYRNAVPLKYLMAQSDSLLHDSVSEKLNASEEEIIVKKDEMIAMRTVPVVNAGHEKIKNHTDSLLESVSDIRDDKKNVIANFKVELWQSPVNYKGYKMGKNKIIFFGVKEEDELKIYKIEDEIYVKHNSNFYKMEYRNDFRSFEKVNDQSVLAKLK